MIQINIVHKDWFGVCILDNIFNKLYREDHIEETGKYEIIDNKLIINWDNWGMEEFYMHGNIYYDSNLIIYLIHQNSTRQLILNNNIIYCNNEIIYEDEYIFENDLIKVNNIIYKQINGNLYCLLDDYYNNTFNLNTRSKSLSNINIIKPIHLYYDNNRLLFSNISLCKNKIIMTSTYYRQNNWNIDLLDINVNNNIIINREIMLHTDIFEGSYIIILELNEYKEKVELDISYDKYKYHVKLKQLGFKDNNISAMTLFKDDYELMKQYILYYNNMGVDTFYLYYNGKIDNILLDKIVEMNVNNLKIYLIEWNYPYYYNEYHYSQTMALNDILYILKNYSKYILFNDFDEYIDNNINFNELINDNPNIDVFVFKNCFAKLGNETIKYSDFYDKFNINDIIKGNYYDKFREKNLIKIDKISTMGVHVQYNIYNKDITELIAGKFYHIVNFEEKNRYYLMYEYV